MSVKISFDALIIKCEKVHTDSVGAQMATRLNPSPHRRIVSRYFMQPALNVHHGDYTTKCEKRQLALCSRFWKIM